MWGKRGGEEKRREEGKGEEGRGEEREGEGRRGERRGEEREGKVRGGEESLDSVQAEGPQPGSSLGGQPVQLEGRKQRAILGRPLWGNRKLLCLSIGKITDGCLANQMECLGKLK